jgi:hypothetical protein
LCRAGGVLGVAALLGVAPTLPITDELCLALGVLVLGTGLTAYVAGTLAILERTVPDPTPTDSIPGAGPN